MSKKTSANDKRTYSEANIQNNSNKYWTIRDDRPKAYRIIKLRDRSINRLLSKVGTGDIKSTNSQSLI